MANDGWRQTATSHADIRQGYLALTDALAIRVRILDGERAYLTLKGFERTFTRDEFEYPIPLMDAEHLLTCRMGRLIEKRRHIVPAGDLTWEVDVFAGEHEGLVLAEIELGSENQPFSRPNWLGEEVSGRPEYTNAYLATADVTR